MEDLPEPFGPPRIVQTASNLGTSVSGLDWDVGDITSSNDTFAAAIWELADDVVPVGGVHIVDGHPGLFGCL